MSHRIKARFNWNGNGDLLRRLNLERGGEVQKAVDKAVMDWCAQYCPCDTGMLVESPDINTEIGSGEIVYAGPYARYQYYGEVMVPNIPVFDDNTGEPTWYYTPKGTKKHLTGRKLKYNKDENPLACSFWDRSVVADHMDDILKEAKNAAGIQ